MSRCAWTRLPGERKSRCGTARLGCLIPCIGRMSALVGGTISIALLKISPMVLRRTGPDGRRPGRGLESTVGQDPACDLGSAAPRSSNHYRDRRSVSAPDALWGDEAHRRAAGSRLDQYARRRASTGEFVERRADTANLRA